MSHGHSHGGGGCRCAAEREEPPEQRGLAYGLYLRIDLERLQCLNESREGSGRGVFKPWEERTDRSKFVESDADEELLFNIPFTGNVKLKGIIIMGEDDDSHPSEMRLVTGLETKTSGARTGTLKAVQEGNYRWRKWKATSMDTGAMGQGEDSPSGPPRIDDGMPSIREQ